MKKILFLLMVGLFIMPAKAQKLLEIYKKGTVKLIPDESFAQNNDWDKIFKNADTADFARKSIIVKPDGSIIINHPGHNYYSEFSPTGKFLKEFNVINKTGVSLKRSEPIRGIINNNTFFTGVDNMGNMTCFDFAGLYIKTLKINYMVRHIVPLPNGKLAVVGWAIWKDKFREFISIVDYTTNKEKNIWEHFTQGNNELKSEMFNYFYKFEKNGMISINTMPFTKYTGMATPPQIACIGENLVVTVPTTGEILIYTLNGQLKSKEKVEWMNQVISVEEQKQIQQNAIDKYKNLKNNKIASWVSEEENKKAQAKIVKEMEADLAKISKPISKPYFITLIKDSDNNLLFFEYPKEKSANKFNVWIYKNGGEFVCQSSFNCDTYNLEINPSKMVFYKGYIYSLQELKNPTQNSLRLVRFKLE